MRLLRSALGAVLVKILSIAALFVASLVYARLLGPSEFGAYSLAVAVASAVAVPATLGLPQFLVREIGRSPGAANSLYHWADYWVAVAGGLSCVIIVATALVMSSDAGIVVLVLAPLPLLSNLTLVRQSVLQALGYTSRGQWAALVFSPCFAMGLVFIAFLVLGSIDAMHVACASIVAAAAALLLTAVQNTRVVP